MGITHHEHASVDVLAVTGSLDDTGIAMELVELARPLADTTLVVDLAECAYVSSVGLAALVRVAQDHGRLAVVRPSEALAFEQLLRLTGIADLFLVCAERDEACVRAAA